MSSIIKKIERKLGDHPNVSSDPDVNPTSGTGIEANQGDGECAAPLAVIEANQCVDPNKSWVENKVQAGMGSGDEPRYKAGSTTSADPKGSGEAAGLGNNN